MGVNNGWTKGRYKSFITSVIRGGFRRWPSKYTCIKSAFVEKKINPSSGKLASFYLCAKCKEHYTSANIQVDHIKPIVDPKLGFISWDSFIEKLFCPEEELQVLCKECHKIKTTQERKERTKYKNE